MKCPYCHNELVDDPNDESKVLCYPCKKKFNKAQVVAKEQLNTSNQDEITLAVEQQDENLKPNNAKNGIAQRIVIPIITFVVGVGVGIGSGYMLFNNEVPSSVDNTTIEQNNEAKEPQEENQNSGIFDTSIKQDEYINAVRSGLEARWSMGDIDEFTDGYQQIKQYRERINKELDAVSKYEGKRFENAELQAVAEKYIEGLHTCITGLQREEDGLDYEGKTFSKGYDQRTAALLEMRNKYGLTVSDEYKQTFDEVLNDAERGGSEYDVFTVESASIKDRSNGYYYVDFILTNNTTKPRRVHWVAYEKLDRDGNLLGTDEIYGPETDIQPGQKCHVEEYLKESDNIDTIKIIRCEYDMDGTRYESTLTEPFVYKIILP